LRWWEEDAEADLLGLIADGKDKIDDNDHEHAVMIGYVHAQVVDLMQDYYNALYARGGDDETIGAALKRGEEQDDDLGTYALVIENLRIDQEWRGLNAGLLGLGLVIRELGAPANFVVLYPMTPGTEEMEKPGVLGRLRTYYARLGFTPWYYNTMRLDLTHATFSDLFEKMINEVDA
jgi:hypothetical protein